MAETPLNGPLVVLSDEEDGPPKGQDTFGVRRSGQSSFSLAAPGTDNGSAPWALRCLGSIGEEPSGGIRHG